MGREILFRGKRKDNGQWVEGYYQQRYDAFENIQHLIFWAKSYTVWEYTEVLLETICQYTGLTDKNGRKIFEGDIVKTFLCVDDHGEPLYEHGKIIYDENNTAFLISCDKQLLEVRIWGNIEVIGNLWDNPELLNQ